MKQLVVIVLLLCSSFFNAIGQSKDTTNKTIKIRPYQEIITNKAVTVNGLFKVHKVENKYYFELPDSLLNTDLLMVSRIIKAAASVRADDLGYAGDLIGEGVLQFSKAPEDKLFLKAMSYTEISHDSSPNGMSRSVLNSNLQPIIAAFDIKAFSPNGIGFVIDVTDFIGKDNDILFFDDQIKKALKLESFQADRSYVEKVNAYPLNIEIRTVKTFGKASGSNAATYELNTSIVLLPKQPMRPRSYDERVGYFSAAYLDFDTNPQGVAMERKITRWRLEPKEADIERYMRGELVTPKKPIVFYIDPATPKKWVPYLIQGVNDWQRSFERAGFKNAIYALPAPDNDPEWSLEDARHNAIVYKASAIKNASGPNIHDPRTGEILETHVNWYHNVLQLIHDWYFVQAAPIDPSARRMNFDDSLMGQLIRFVSSHEIGHTLGLEHNFGASSTVPVDSLRSKNWVEANGICPSIMDYARFNYVAQPEDSVSEKGIFPRIGAYDDWAIEWGYRWMPAFPSAREEEKYMTDWLVKRIREDKRLWFDDNDRDSRSQMEDLGDDAIKASSYGIKNLQREMEHLPEWTREFNHNYENLTHFHELIINQYLRYIGHVARYIGGTSVTKKTIEGEDHPAPFVPRMKQKEALKFLQTQLLDKPPLWLIDQPFLRFITLGPASNIQGIYTFMLQNLTSNFKFFIQWHLESVVGGERDIYTLREYLWDLKKAFLGNIGSAIEINKYRRQLQKAYINRLIVLTQAAPPRTGDFVEDFLAPQNYFLDISSLARAQLKELEGVIRTALLTRKQEEMTRLHLQDLADRIRIGLDPRK